MRSEYMRFDPVLFFAVKKLPVRVCVINGTRNFLLMKNNQEVTKDS